MKKRKTPMRMCVGCRQMKPKRELVRIVRKAADGEVALDRTSKLPGRGAYVCPNIECYETAVKSKALERVLEAKVSEEAMALVKREILRYGLQQQQPQ